MVELIFEDREKLWDYVRENWNRYVAIKKVIVKKEERKGGKDEEEAYYVTKIFDEPCVLQQQYSLYPVINVHHYILFGLGRIITRLKREKMSFDRLREEYIGQPWIKETLEEIISEREKVLNKFYEMFETNPVVEWATSIKGLGPHDALLFLSFIDPHIATSAGKATRYWALAGPESIRRKGEKGKSISGRPHLRGEAWFMASRIWMKKDPYYLPLAKAKKEYYLTKLPEDEKGRKKHAQDRAYLWLGHLLVSHAWEVYRRYERLPVNPHRTYIPPKPHEDAVFSDDKIINAILKGELIETEQPRQT